MTSSLLLMSTGLALEDPIVSVGMREGALTLCFLFFLDDEASLHEAPNIFSKVDCWDSKVDLIATRPTQKFSQKIKRKREKKTKRLKRLAIP